MTLCIGLLIWKIKSSKKLELEVGELSLAIIGVIFIILYEITYLLLLLLLLLLHLTFCCA